MSQNDIAALKLTAVTVSFAPDATIQFEDGIRAYAVSKTIPDDQISAAANTPKGKAYVNAMLGPRIKAEIEKVMAGQLNGSRPVRLEVVVGRFELPSAVQRILIGGHRFMSADANLVDARTGAIILANGDARTMVYTGQGVPGAAIQAGFDNASDQGVVERLVDNYAESYRDWLLRRT